MPHVRKERNCIELPVAGRFLAGQKCGFDCRNAGLRRCDTPRSNCATLGIHRHAEIYPRLAWIGESRLHVAGRLRHNCKFVNPQAHGVLSFYTLQVLQYVLHF